MITKLFVRIGFWAAGLVLLYLMLTDNSGVPLFYGG